MTAPASKFCILSRLSQTSRSSAFLTPGQSTIPLTIDNSFDNRQLTIPLTIDNSFDNWQFLRQSTIDNTFNNWQFLWQLTIPLTIDNSFDNWQFLWKLTIDNSFDNRQFLWQDAGDFRQLENISRLGLRFHFCVNKKSFCVVHQKENDVFMETFPFRGRPRLTLSS